MDTTLLHNPACSKSRAALALLRARGIDVRVVDYLETPLDATQLTALAATPGLDARALVRMDDVVAAGLALPPDDAGLLALLAAQPRFLQRPVCLHGGRGVIGRPPERVVELLD